LYVIALSGSDNWWSIVDPTSDGLFGVYLSSTITASTENAAQQVIFLY
jgi:hypothetical protein